LVRAETRSVSVEAGSKWRAAWRLELKEYRPMTVRWKPLLFLSGLFLAVALVGVVAITLTLAPPSSQSFLKRARAAQQAGNFPNAEIDFKQALQLEPRNAEIHDEFAKFYADWAQVAPVDKRSDLRNERLGHLTSAAKFDKTLKSPRQQLLKDSMDQDLVPESSYWARELLTVEPDNLDAHYVLAAAALDSRTPDVALARRHLQVLDQGNASTVRRLWIKMKLAASAGDQKAVDAAVAQGRKIELAADADPVDRLAKLRLIASGWRADQEPAQLEAPIQSLLAEVKLLCRPDRLATTRVVRVRFVLEQTQRSLTDRAAKLAGAKKETVERLVDAIEVELESIFKLALASEEQADLQTYLTYADHLRVRRQPKRCLELVDKALKSPQASRRNATAAVMGLHTVAIQTALANSEDKDRFDQAGPHIQSLLECADPQYQGLGHLFAGSIDLDRSGIARDMTEPDPAFKQQFQPRLRASAIEHLKLAASQLPNVAEAQARYGVALVLAGEQSLGRQFLQTALRLGSLDAQYHLWAAWTILQAGYPEEAEPIVTALFEQVSQGAAPRELAGPLHLLRGEIYQARRTPQDLSKAAAEFDRAIAAGETASLTAIMRLAQIDVQLGNHVRALARIDALNKDGKGSPSAERLAVLTLEEQGNLDAARARLRSARSQYPRSAELAGLEAALLTKQGKPNDADAVLEKFLAGDPDSANLVMMRAQIQAEQLKNVAKARELLLAIADKTESSAPLVQLAGLELDSNQLDAAETVIAKIHTRWKEAATGDVLEAHLALKRGRAAEAIEHFDAALKKDPDNKIVQFWKAQLDGQSGMVAEATKSLEAIVRDKPIKELDSGTTLMTAAQSALASLSLRTGDLDDAIRRFQELKRDNQNGTLTKADRWQLITAYVAKGQWTAAKRELAALLNDPKNLPSDEERVRGANFYRQQGENAAALAQLDYVLQVNPANAAAVVTRSYILLQAKEPDQAAAILQKAIELTNKDPKKPVPSVFHLMLAAVENNRPPADTALGRATAVLDRGLEGAPDSADLVQAKYVALRSAGNARAATEFVEAKAKAYPQGPFRRNLVSIYRELRQFDQAARLLAELSAEFPDDTNLAAALVQVISLQASDAAAVNQPDKERALNDQAAAMIQEFRGRFRTNPVFLQAECDIVARRGDFPRAIELTRELDQLSKTSPMGAILRARLYAAMGKPADMAQAYTEAIERSPRQLELRVLLGQTRLKLGEVDEALRQAKLVLDVDKSRTDALLLQARALAKSGKAPGEIASAQQAAIEQLQAAIKANPRWEEAYHALADIHRERKDRAQAITVLKEDLKANPADATAVARLIEALAQPAATGQPSSASDLDQAQQIAHDIAAREDKGQMILALAIGFNRAHRLGLAAPYAQAAAAKLNTPAARLNYGDLLLTLAESERDTAKAQTAFKQAVEQYDLVLKAEPNSIEAVNNKAWILHTYLDQTQEALDLVLALQKRVNPVALPAEFYDTLGSIQQAVGLTREAEQSYLSGLRKSENHAVLNYHFGKMIAGDPSQALKAKAHLNKAIASRDKLAPPMAEEAVHLIQVIDQQRRGPRETSGRDGALGSDGPAAKRG
jgi:cellulose synthase operon protein C